MLLQTSIQFTAGVYEHSAEGCSISTFAMWMSVWMLRTIISPEQDSDSERDSCSQKSRNVLTNNNAKH